MGTLEQFVKTTLKKLIAEDYPHLRLPSIVYASIAAARTLPDAAPWHEYTLRVIDRNGNRLAQYPALPGVRSQLRLEVGAVVAVGLCNGELEPVIIGAVTL